VVRQRGAAAARVTCGGAEQTGKASARKLAEVVNRFEDVTSLGRQDARGALPFPPK